jgi:hypothetical protein
MIYAYDVMDVIKNYGISKFYEQVREHICTIVQRSEISFVETDIAVQELYQKYTLAYVVATKARSIDLLVELLFEDSHDPIGNWNTVHEKSIDDLNVMTAIDNLTKNVSAVSTDAFTLETDSLQVFPNSYGGDDNQQMAFQAVCGIFSEEMENQTGLFGLINQLMPGTFNRYVGDDYFNAVVMCDAPVLESVGYLSI